MMDFDKALAGPTLNADTEKAIKLCRIVEAFAPRFGCHVALTGGCLYRDGKRKDIDILFYRIRQAEKVDHEGLKEALSMAGISNIAGFGWILKGEWEGIGVDMFFPEEIDGGDYPAEEQPK